MGAVGRADAGRRRKLEVINLGSSPNPVARVSETAVSSRTPTSWPITTDLSAYAHRPDVRVPFGDFSDLVAGGRKQPDPLTAAAVLRAASTMAWS